MSSLSVLYQRISQIPHFCSRCICSLHVEVFPLLSHLFRITSQDYELTQLAVRYGNQNQRLHFFSKKNTASLFWKVSAPKVTNSASFTTLDSSVTTMTKFGIR